MLSIDSSCCSVKIMHSAFALSPEGKALASKVGLFAEAFAGLSARYTDFAMNSTLQEFANHPAFLQLQQLQQGQP